jgi:hypothetical protein
MKVLLSVAGAIVAAHGLIHVMGFVAYWPLAKVAELPYKTALAGGRWEVGGAGMRIFALLWLAAALGFVVGLVGLAVGQAWWRPVMVGSMVLSTALIALDWAPAYRGSVINAGIAVALVLVSLLRVGLPLR